MFCEIWKNATLSLCHDYFQPGLFITKTWICYLVLKTSCMLKSVEWKTLVRSWERRVMWSKCVCLREGGSTLCT